MTLLQLEFKKTTSSSIKSYMIIQCIRIHTTSVNDLLYTSCSTFQGSNRFLHKKRKEIQLNPAHALLHWPIVWLSRLSSHLSVASSLRLSIKPASYFEGQCRLFRSYILYLNIAYSTFLKTSGFSNKFNPCSETPPHCTG